MSFYHVCLICSRYGVVSDRNWKTQEERNGVTHGGIKMSVLSCSFLTLDRRLDFCQGALSRMYYRRNKAVTSQEWQSKELLKATATSQFFFFNYLP